MSQLTELQRAIHDRQMIAFVGAGLSRRANYPAWTELLKRLAAKIGTRLPLTDDPLWNAEEIRIRYEKKYGSDDRFREDIARIYRPRKITDPAIRQLVRLPFRHFVTTNYDNVIERTDRKIETLEWRDEAAVNELITNPVRKQRVCLHIHGYYKNPKSIVLCETDYSRRYVESLSAHRKLFALLATQRLVFFGFSLGDAAFEEILRVSRLTLGTGTPRHFAVLPLRSEDRSKEKALRQRLNRKYDIEPIFFEDGKFEEFAEIINRLAGKDASLPEPALLDDEDPNKGKFGGKAAANGRRLSARVTQDPDDEDWFAIDLEVAATNRSPITDPVRFHLHPTFRPASYYVTPKNGRATDRIWGYGAFTVGAVIKNEGTRLELDLSKLAGAPRAFRER